MKKAIKISLITLASLFTMVILAAILIPVFFKEDIQKAVDAEIDKQVRANVFYDTDQFDLSLFRSFPNVSVGMGDFGIAGEGVFETDTLVFVNNFELTVDLLSLFGDKITVSKIQLDKPEILVLVLEDGSANYDIMEETEEDEEEQPEEDEEGLNLSINRWEINDGDIVYYDQSMDFYTALRGLNHSGSGDFESDIFDMITETTVYDLSLGYEGTEYIVNKAFAADVVMNMDMANMKFVFAENSVALNDFGFGFDGFLAMPGEDIDMDITFKGQQIDLKSILSLIPGAYQEYLDGINASGEVGFEGFVRGTYNEEKMPHVNTSLTIRNGALNTPDLPDQLEKIKTDFTFDYPTAELADASLNLDFAGEMTGQKSRLKLDLQNLDNYQWDVDLKADMDLAKMTKLLPMKDTELRGLVNAELQTKGKMSDVEAERWQALPTSGSLVMNDFFYKSPDIGHPVSIQKLDARFDPAKVELGQLNGRAGQSDFNVKGQLTHYLAFALGENELLQGTLTHSSNMLNVDEWMSESAPDTTTSEESEPMEVVRIPENIDFTFLSDIKKIQYTNLEIEDFIGQLQVVDGSVKIKESGFNLLNGRFTMNGEYASKPEQPTFDFDFGIKELSIPKAFAAFTPIQKLVPVAEKTTGNFSTNFAANGALGSDMMPVLSSISGSGLVQIAEAAVKDIKILEEVQKLAKWKKGGSNDKLAAIKEVILSARIDEGRLFVKPFDIKIAGNEAVVSGSTGLDGSLDYALALEVPSGQVGQTVNSQLAKFTGGKQLISEFVDLNIGIGGTYDKPKVQLLGAKPGEGKSGLQASVKEQVNEQIDKAEAKAKAEIDKAKAKALAAKQEAEQKAKAKADSLKKVAEAEAEKKKEEAKKEMEKKAKKAVKGLFGKKKK